MSSGLAPTSSLRGRESLGGMPSAASLPTLCRQSCWPWILSLYPLKQPGTGILLILLTLVNAVLGLQQEGKAATAVAALQKMMIVTARVLRDGQHAEIPAEHLVPGDVVSIEAGDLVPADGRLLEAATLEVAESALTGESLPVVKGTSPVDEADTPLGDRTDMVYTNTSVTRGACSSSSQRHRWQPRSVTFRA